jgi:hypothetical protein
MERIQNKITELEQLKANNDELIKEIDNRIDNVAKELEAIQNKNSATLSISEKVDLKTKETEAITKINTLRATKEDIQKEFKDQRKKLIIELSELREFFTKEENEFLSRKNSLLDEVINYAVKYANKKLTELQKDGREKTETNETLKAKVNSYLKEVEGIPLIESECAPYSPYAFTYTQTQLETASQELVRTFCKYN